MQIDTPDVKPNYSMHSVAYHQSAAMHAAKMVRLQYTRESKNLFRRECLEHLKASLSHEGAGV